MKLVRQVAAVTLALLVTIAAGCNDPYSQRRVRMREDALRNQANGFVTQEEHNAERWRNEIPAIRDQWNRDKDLFQQRAPAVGDYAW